MEYFLFKQLIFFVLLCVSFLECSEVNEDAPAFTCPYRYSNTNSNDSETWHAFLNSLFCKFSEYNVQVAKRSYSTNYTVDFETEDCDIRELIGEVQGTEIDKNNFERFLNKTLQCNVTEYDGVENIHLTGVEIEELNLVLSLTLRDKLYVNCYGSNVYIKGNYITTGDIIDIFNKNRKLTDAKCNDLLISGKTKFVNIFALNTFFIDITVNSSFTNSQKVAHMSVIAPKWENIGKNRIELKGEDAELPSVRNVIDGEPGNPGSPGGNFFGIGREFVNCMNLEIIVSGGDGSRGQDGRKGKNGMDGKTPTTPSDTACNGEYCVGGNKIDDFNCEKGECTPTFPMEYFECTYDMFGKTGKKGENGGKGGKGGKGGYEGNIALIELKSHSEISFYNNSGRDGSDGKGGAGGLGGKRGNDITVKCKKSCPIPGQEKRYNCWSRVSTKTSSERAESGQRGPDGANTRGMEYPKSAIELNNLDKAKIINEYKSYLRENLHKRCTKVLLNDFLNQLETNTNVKNTYNTLSLIDDLQHLEDQYHKLNRDLNLIPFYQSLLNRINEYAYAPKETGDLRTYKKVLCYVYTAALGTMQNIQDNIESNLIIDIPNYLRSVKNEIDDLKDLKNSQYKAILINKYKDEYKRKIDMKIDEAKELITKEIRPEIHNIGTAIDEQIELLVNKVIYLQEKAIIEQQKLAKKQQQLENNLGLQGMFSILKIFGAVVSILGPVGAVAGTVIEIGSTIAESFISDNENVTSKVLAWPQGVSQVESINNEIRSINNQRITSLRNSLDAINSEIQENPDILTNMSLEISGIKNRLDKLDANKLDFKEIQDLVNKLETTMESQEEKADPKNAKQMNVIKNLKNIVQVSSLLSDSYSKYKNRQAKLKELSRAIGQNEAKLKKLKQYEDKIYSLIIPMLQNIQSDLQDIASKLGTKSKVALDLTKWHVERTLRDMVLLMRQLTREFEIEDNLARCLEKLEEAMNALIRVHQHVQDYQEDQTLAIYIAEISSVTVTDVIVANNVVLQEALRDAVRDLEITVRSNIVLQRYKIALNAFKQFVFPFAHHYFQYLIPPPNLALSDNKNDTTVDDLVSKAAAELEKINSKLEDYKHTVTIRDECIGHARFKRGSEPSKPFFTWKNKHHKDMISKLLSGHAVTIKSDIRDSAPDKDAIKFNRISFNFKTESQTLQDEINNKLNGFMIVVTHLGNSDYRYADKFYEIMTSSTQIWYYFSKKSEGFSNSYKKIMDGDVTLSPYASWKVKLDNVTNSFSFNDLIVYKDIVNLKLEGSGYFLNNRISHCKNLIVDKYYKAIDAY